jgi:hypothetical protein
MTPWLASVIGNCILLLVLYLVTRRLALIEQRLTALERGESGATLRRASPPSGATASPGLPAGASDGIAEALRSGNKIEAIRLYRLATGVGLQEAKDYVERLERQR